MSDHARLAPSSAHRWGPGGCPASPAMEALYPEDTESEEAREGTAAHWYLTETLCGRDPGRHAPNGHPINDEMREAAKGAVARCAAIRVEATPGCAFRVEERVHAHVTIHPDNDGTPDVYMVDFVRQYLYLIDYKYGHGYVEHRNNWQCVNYDAAILESEGVPQGEWAKWTIVNTICQPRNYSPKGTVRTSTMTGAVFVQRVAELRDAAHAASDPNARLQTGEHCRNCAAQTQCPANQQAGFIAMDVSRRATPLDIPPAALGLELRMIEQALQRLKARETALQASALGMLKRGDRVPWWTTGNVQSRERWKLPAETAIAIGRTMGVELAKPLEAITPAQARDAGIDPVIVSQLAERPSGAVKLVAADSDEAERVFGPAPVK